MLSNYPIKESSKADAKRILCVDDEPYILSTLKRFFCRDGFEILEASSAEKGMELLESCGPVDLIISDFRMPGMNGIDFLGQVHEKWPKTVGILLSGYAELPVVASALDQHFIVCHLPKPWNRAELRTAVKEALLS